MYSGNVHTTCTLYLLKKLFTLRPLDNLSVEGLVRLWAHEALRLFQDRLVEDVERQWTDENIDNVAMRFFPGNIFMSSLYCVSSSSATCICPLPSIWTSNLSPLSSVVGLPGPRFPSLGLDVAVYPPTMYFSTSIIAFSVPGINRDQALERPILYSNWLSKDYVPVNRDQLREYVKARLKVECRTYIGNLNIGEEKCYSGIFLLKLRFCFLGLLRGRTGRPIGLVRWSPWPRLAYWPNFPPASRPSVADWCIRRRQDDSQSFCCLDEWT